MTGSPVLPSASLCKTDTPYYACTMPVRNIPQYQ